MTTALQRAFDRGDLALPAERPPWFGERDWALLLRHVRERASFAALGQAAGVSGSDVRQVTCSRGFLSRWVTRPRSRDVSGVAR